MILQWVFPSPSPPSRLANLPPSPHPVEAVERPSSPTSSANELQDFDIFLSFRGEDTRNGFTGHLYDALRRRSLKTFIDNIELHKGESIHKLLTYIERSKVFVPIISKGYADSKWCLKEIAKIVECEGGRLIVPIFLDVDPSHVRHQDGPFQSAFKSYDKDKKVDKAEVDKWRDALKKVANISGYSLQADANGHEATLVDKVVHRLLQHLDSGLLFVADHPVGMESRFDDMNNLLQIERDGVKMVGLVGTGGIGKTTIAMYVFNKLRSKFGAATFVNNIREYWKNDSGKTQLMRQLVKDILDDKVTSIDNIQRGQQLLLQRLPPKKFLIVLDDVDHQQQFNQLIGERLLKRFASGTRIIMTTRDESVLSLCRVDGIYKPKLMDADQSLDLFKRYAFQSSHQPEDMFVDMSMKVVAVAGGLPLALIVFGSYLSDKSDLAKWQDYLDQLKKTSKKGIHDSLKISYDGLSDFEKWIFLDIACFFVGHSQVEATLMWESLNWLPRSSIEVLQQKSLITRVREDEPFDMHDLIRDMGRDIVRHGKPYPSEWSRVWTANDTLNMLGENRRNKVIEGINLSGPGEELSSEAFGKMTKLRVLRVNSVEFKGENFMLPKSLKVLFFTGSNIKSHSSCNLENLVTLEIDVANSMSEFLVRESASKVFNALKFLKISSHHSIRLVPDFSNMPHLERLEFSNCYFLVEIPQSIGKLRQLKYLKFFEFLNVEKLPDAICQLTSLQTLRIKRFPRLQSLPERLGNLKSLNTLELDELAITSTPSSIGQLTKLKEMYLTNLDRLQSLPDSISSLNSLQVFNVEGTDLKGMKIDGVDLRNIVRLEISSCNCLSVLPDSSLKKARALRITDSTIKELPESIKAMEKIEQLSLRCKNLMALPDWLPNLKTLEVDCEFLTSIINKIFSLRSIESLSLCCADLEELPAPWLKALLKALSPLL